MSRFELKLPQMGESVAEATITAWLKEVGDSIEMDESVVEIATDKVDSDVPCEVEGVLVEKLYQEGDVVQVGQTFAIIQTEGETKNTSSEASSASKEKTTDDAIAKVEEEVTQLIEQTSTTQKPPTVESSEDKFYSPLVKSIANAENISQQELDAIQGTGLAGRVTKEDMLTYVKNRGKKTTALQEQKAAASDSKTNQNTITSKVLQEGDELITLSRMGKLISDHMVHSKQKAAHVQSFIEVDVTNLVNWRNKVKDAYYKKQGQKLTFTPIFMIAVTKAIQKYPLVNISFDGVQEVVVKKAINLGMASALPDGNLIVPVIKNAENLSLNGMVKAVNDLANRSKNNELKPDDIKGGTYTVTNIGSFGSIFGTPIINQPESAILALGAIRKVPAVIETPEGDFIGIRQKMYITHSYDHRVINGALGGMFIKEIKDYLEAWDVNKEL
ncbi:dihydrolipoamide acetyltransferase family protein [Ochrovirga pacifica]|uniref:dihydrolipoamide acetyltransferase family protein n=1 Tax=Ochrovirga pacifica TaxID=1042376 RepID=UPI0002557B77|nr:dihydrolipoamide acetyltransferase family protein [Ochrovirga pacifica]